MRNMRTAAIVIGLLTTLPAFGLAMPNATPSPSKTAKSSQVATAKADKAAMHATKGVVKLIDANKLVIMRSPRSSREMTFALNPSTERVGTVKVGSTVDVRYRTEAKQRVATAITVVHAKQPPFARGSQQ